MGLVFAVFLIVFVLPFVEFCDLRLLQNKWAPLITISASLLAIYFYPGSDRWTPAR